MDWWNKNGKDRIEDFKNWVGDSSATTKIEAARLIMRSGYKSILDVGCGLCDMKAIFDECNYDIDYVGIDTCSVWREHAENRGALYIVDNIEAPQIDYTSIYRKFDVVFSRHVLEHLKTFDKALINMLSLADKEVINVFFMPPTDYAEYSYGFDDGAYLFHNKYAKNDILYTCRVHGWPKISIIESGDESIFRIMR